MYPVCRILYKKENSPGWYYAIMSGSIEECTKMCKKLKKENNWYDYECKIEEHYTRKIDIPFQDHYPEAYKVFLCTSLVYNPYDNKWYYQNEIMPYPVSLKNKFNILVKDDEDEVKPREEADFLNTDIEIYLGTKK